MFGISDSGIWLAYLLAFTCLLYSIWFKITTWNKEDDEKTNTTKVASETVKDINKIIPLFINKAMPEWFGVFFLLCSLLVCLPYWKGPTQQGALASLWVGGLASLFAMLFLHKAEAAPVGLWQGFIRTRRLDRCISVACDRSDLICFAIISDNDCFG